MQLPSISRVRCAELAIGFAFNKLTAWGFDFVIYPLVIAWLGLKVGFVVMASLSFIVCWLLLKLYDWLKRDWMGLEMIKGWKDYEGSNRLARWLAWVLRRSDPVAFIFLSLKYDAFLVTVYFRRGNFNGMTGCDWRHFWISWLIGNVWWSLLCFAGVETASELWRWLRAG